MKSITKLLHSHRGSNTAAGELHCPVFRNTAYDYENAEEIADVFQGKKAGYTYGRQNNPTVTSLENKISILELAKDTICFATGMSAIASCVFSLLEAGDEIIVSQFIFGNTKSLMHTFEKYGLKVNFVNGADYREVEKRIN